MSNDVGIAGYIRLRFVFAGVLSCSSCHSLAEGCYSVTDYAAVYHGGWPKCTLPEEASAIVCAKKAGDSVESAEAHLLKNENAYGQYEPLIVTPNDRPYCRAITISTYPANHKGPNDFCTPARLEYELQIIACSTRD